MNEQRPDFITSHRLAFVSKIINEYRPSTPQGVVFLILNEFPDLDREQAEAILVYWLAKKEGKIE